LIESGLSWLARGQLRHPRASLTLVGLLTLAALLLLPRFRIDPDVTSLFPRGEPAIELLRATEHASRSARGMFLRVRGEELESRLPALLDDLEASPFLAEVAGTKADFGGELARQARAAPLWFLSAATLQALQAELTGDGPRAALEESKRMLAEDPVLAREVVLRDPLGLRWILESAARASLVGHFEPESPFLLIEGGGEALVRVVGRERSFDIEFSRALMADLEERTRDLDVEFIGAYSIARADAARIRGDLTSSIAVSIPLLVLFLTWSTRSFLLPLVMMLPVALSVLWALAFGGALLGPLTPLAVGSAAILMGLGLDFAIHYAERYW
jgi:predicted exporter